MIGPKPGIHHFFVVVVAFLALMAGFFSHPDGTGLSSVLPSVSAIDIIQFFPFPYQNSRSNLRAPRRGPENEENSDDELSDLIEESPEDFVCFRKQNFTFDGWSSPMTASAEAHDFASSSSADVTSQHAGFVRKSTKSKVSKTLPASQNLISGIVDRFIRLFEELRNIPENDLFEAQGKFKLKKQLAVFVAKGSPIEMILPAFPCKSPNRKKTLGIHPDRGEELSIERLDGFCEQIKGFYSPGCKLVIMHDGRVFSDIIGVPDEDVTQYENELHSFPSKYIEWDSLDPYFPSDSPDQVREKLMEQYGKLSIQQLQSLISEREETTYLLRGFIKFLFGDREWDKSLSNSKIKKICEQAAKKMILRNSAFSALITEKFPNHIRLSIHGHPNCGPKYGVRLVKDMDFCITPWHNVAVEFRNGKTVLMKHETATKIEGLELILREGKPWVFRESLREASSPGLAGEPQ